MKSLKDKLAAYFGVAHCSFGEAQKNEEGKLNKREIKQGAINFEQSKIKF